MTNIPYYKFEAALVSAILSGEADAVRGALAGCIRHSSDARFANQLHAALINNADTKSEFRAKLKAIEPL